MKIAILTPTYSAFSGIDRVVELQAEKLIDQGNNVTIFCFKAGMQPKRAKLVEWGINDSLLSQRVYRLLYILDRPQIARLGRDLEGFDKVIAHLYPMTLMGDYAKKKFGCKYVYHNHGVATPELFSKLEAVYMRIFNMFSNWSIKSTDECISISSYLKDQLKQETGKDSTIEYDPIDTSRFKQGVNTTKIREKYKLGNSPVCLYVGRISPHKGIDYLIRAFNHVLKQRPDVKLLIVGKETFDDYATRLKNLAMDVNKDAIIFCGFVDDSELPDYYGGCNVYCTASLWEGYDMPIAEAAACGRPSVCFDIGPHKEVIKSGTVVPRGDVTAFGDAILALLN